MKTALSHITAAALAALTTAAWQDIRILYTVNPVVTVVGLACWGILAVALTAGLAHAAWWEAYHKDTEAPPEPQPQEVVNMRDRVDLTEVA